MMQHAVAVSQIPGPIPLQDIFITHELERRPRRPPDYQAENRCLVALARELAHSPEFILQRVTEMARELCYAESTGLSLLEDYEGQTVFRWRALAGPFAANLGGMTQRNFSPCGLVVDCRQVQLFLSPGRYYPYLNEAQPPIVEVLLLPFFVAGEAKGTLWVMAHDEQRQFDAEDVRILSSLAEFTGVAYQVTAEIAERKQAEEALRRSEQELADFFENATVGLHWVGPDGFILRVNQAELDLLGYTREEYLGHHVAEFHADQEVVTDMLQRLTQGESLHDYEARLRCKDGSIRHVLIASNVLSKDGQFIHTRCFTRDITERKQMEEALRVNEKRFRSLIERSADAIALFGADGAILYGSPSTSRILGYSLDEFVGRNAFDVIHRDDHDLVQKQLAEAVRQPEVAVPVAARVQHKDGSWRWLEGNFTNLLAEPSIQGIVNNYRDVTDRKQAEEDLARQAEELQRSNTELQQFAYIVSHDLNEPLRTVASFVQLLAKRYRGKLDTTAEEFIEFAVDGTKRVQELLKDLLTYTRVGGQPREFTVVDCAVVLTRVLGDLQLAIKDNTAEITYDPLPTVHGDAAQIGLVFQNLIGNALKFRSAQPPRIHISARRAGNQWLFTVSDNGIGLDPKQAERIFLVFQRLHSRKAYPGTGIGLAICKKIVERHGGRIWVESVPGQGATFFFTLNER